MIKLGKTLYSLMLSDEVVREIDILAHRLGTNRSSLVNRILAEHVSLTTPEQRINEIFAALDKIMSPSRDIVPFYEPNTPTMSFKSCLEYKYRPTVRYEVELFSSPRNGSQGMLSVVFRTQSASLLDAMAQFFRLWKLIEDRYNSMSDREYALYDGKFVRSISCLENVKSAELARAISEYVQLFDSAMKRYIAGISDPDEIAAMYVRKLNEGNISI